MKPLAVAVILFLFQNLKSQTQVNLVMEIDGNTKPMSYIKILIDDEILYSDSNGYVFISKRDITCGQIGLDDFTLDIDQCKIHQDSITIVLKDKIVQMPSIVIGNRKEVIFEERKASKLYRNVLVKPKQEFLTLIKFNDQSRKYLKKVSFEIDKTKGVDFRTDSIVGVLKINLYKNDTETNQLDKLYQSSYLSFEYDKREEIIHQLSELLEITDEFYLGIEYIGSINSDGNFSNETYYLRPVVSNKEFHELKIKSFIATTSSRDLKDLITVNELEEKMKLQEKRRGRSLNLSFVILPD
jgi:hypothetical protein